MDARGRSGRHAREGKLKFRPVPDPVRPAVPPDHGPGPVRRIRGAGPSDSTGRGACAIRALSSNPGSLVRSPPGARPGLNRTGRSQTWSTGRQTGRLRVCLDRILRENKDSADIITWREFEALRNQMRREFRAQDDVLKGTVQGISQKMDTTHETVTTMKDKMIDIERALQMLQMTVDNLKDQQQQEDEDLDPQDAVPGRGVGRGNRPRGWVELGRPGRGHDEEDGLGKPKFSIPKFEGGADVEEYLTWELKIEKLWNLHPNYTEDRKIKLASSEFDGYALRWWDALVRNRQEDGELPIITWRAMKEAMNSRFVPTNYLRTIYDKLTLLRQGVKTVDEYYMEMELLMQRGRVRESLEMTMHFLNGLKNLRRVQKRYPLDYHHCELRPVPFALLSPSFAVKPKLSSNPRAAAPRSSLVDLNGTRFLHLWPREAVRLPLSPLRLPPSFGSSPNSDE
ncbi:hypothetical protein QYE76_055520 [Lolium multiflorum]|uniref:Retrotransposon gag domain-containing protein n=1 Tax=Lolium multiflorum TaxID=4521 RepID=A0AAD8WMD6_LOLMU|nr:hypothetical protein QYE76_055520 [Lolium multiflorum]